MKFRDVAIKNLKMHMRRYLGYFLCITFSITVFFMFTTLLYNKELQEAAGDGELLKNLVSVPTYGLVIFSIFFISYAHTSFIKSRQSEWGLYLGIGMEKRNIFKIILFENCIISLFSTVLAFILGTVFSKLFFMVIIKIMGLEDINFYLGFKNYIVTAGVFLLIFTFVILKSLFTFKKLEITEIIKEGRKKDTNSLKSPVWGILGITMISINFLVLKKVGLNENNANLLLLIGFIMCVIGLYLMISQFGNLLGFIDSFNKDRWYKNLLFNTDIRYKINQNKKVIFSICLVQMIVIYLSTNTYIGYSVLEEETKLENPFHLSYIEIADRNRISDETLENIINSGETSLVDNKKLEVLDMIDESNKERILVTSNQQYNAVFNKDLKIEKGNAFFLKRSSIKNINDYTGGNLKLSANEYDSKEIINNLNKKEYSFNIKDALGENHISEVPYIFNSKVYAVNNEEFEEIKKNNNNLFKGIIHLVNFEDWKSVYPVQKALNEKLEEYNSENARIKFIENDPEEDKRLTEAISSAGSYKYYKSLQAMIFFLTIFTSVLFFISSGCLLYFKYYTELERTKDKYKKLICIGTSEDEISKMVCRDMKFMFFMPYVLGSIIGIIYSYIVSARSTESVNSLIASVCITAVCLMLQGIYYSITKAKFVNEVIEM